MNEIEGAVCPTESPAYKDIICSHKKIIAGTESYLRWEPVHMQAVIKTVW